MPPPVTSPSPRGPTQGTIVVLGDTQRTTWMEVLVGREQNDAARVALIQQIAADERPAFVVHLGDMVATGGSAKDWQYYDRLMAPLTALGIRIYPVLGNHDYWGDDEAALRHARERYPELGSGGHHAIRHRSLGLIWLDSNLEGAAASNQTAWFGRALASFDASPDVTAIVVFTHHPPYTNGKGRKPEPYVARRVLPPFFAARKTVAMMSGHVHGYERFQVGGRAFIVSGGGGGPRVTYAVGADAPFAPAYVTGTGVRRPFNYVVIEPLSDALRFTVKCLKSERQCESGILETFTVSLRTESAAPSGG